MIFIFSNLEKSGKITSDKLIILTGDIPSEFETWSETCFKYAYFSKNMKPVQLFTNFFNLYAYSFLQFVILYGYSSLYGY